MTTVPYPLGVAALGKEVLTFVPTLTDPAAATAAELNGATAINITCAVRGFNMTQTQSKTKKFRLCSIQGTDVLGRVETEIEAPTFIDDPQEPDASPDYKHKSLIPGTTGWLIRRRGLAADPNNYVAYATGQLYKAIPVEFGVRNDVAINPEDDAQEFEYTQEIAVKGEIIEGVVAA
jgi:hypothetical protein